MSAESGPQSLGAPEGFATTPERDLEPHVFSRKDISMTQAIRQASNTLVIAARLYKELAISASDLLRVDSYRS